MTLHIVSVPSLETLVERVRHPPSISLPVRDIGEVWRSSMVIVTTSRPAELDFSPDIGGRVRGLLGKALLELSEKDALCELAFRMLFGDIPAGVTRPFNLSVQGAREKLRLKVTLHGAAEFLAPAIERALQTGFQSGLALSVDAKSRASLNILDSRIERNAYVESPKIEEANWVWMVLRGPLLVLQGRHAALDGQRFTRGLWRRVRDLARWQDVGLAGNETAIVERAGSLRWEYRYLNPVHWSRHSSRQRGRVLPMEASVGSFGVSGALGDIAPLIALGATIQAGARTAFGFGAYDWFWTSG